MIEIKNLTKKYADKVIFEDVNLRLDDGLSYAIVGPSGTGKTTFLNILGGLDSPSHGQVLIDNEPLNAKTLPKLRQKTFGFVFQNYGLMDKTSIAENLKVGMLNKKYARADEKAAMELALKQVKLEYLPLTQKIFTLSGGEQQRVALARIILKKPTIIFADEPTGSVDEKNAEVIINHLLNDFPAQAIKIIATHAPQVWQKCDYILKLDHQKIEMEAVK